VWSPNANADAQIDTVAGATPWQVAVPSLLWDSTTSAASIYGVSGITSPQADDPACEGGVSIWNVPSNTMVFPATGAGTTHFNLRSGVSWVYASPVFSGNSIFIVATHYLNGGGTSIFQFYNQNLSQAADAGQTDTSACGAGLRSANVIEPGGMTIGLAGAQAVVPTPAIIEDNGSGSGGTVYVVDVSGGVSMYDTQNLALKANDPAGAIMKTNAIAYWAPIGDWQGGAPVTNGVDKLVIPWRSSVSCFETLQCNWGGGSGVSPVWELDFDDYHGVADNTYQIVNTPVVSNGYVWVQVANTLAGWNTNIYRFWLGSTVSNGNVQVVVSNKNYTAAEPMFVNSEYWFVTENPVVERVTDLFGRGQAYWAQYKYDAQKTGHNTRPDEDTTEWGSSGGCFISTIK
jgi:hypothetical protein